MAEVHTPDQPNDDRPHRTPVPERTDDEQQNLVRTLEALRDLPGRLKFLFDAVRREDGQKYSQQFVGEWCVEATGGFGFTRAGLSLLISGRRKQTDHRRLVALAEFFRVKPTDLDPTLSLLTPSDASAQSPPTDLDPVDREIGELLDTTGLLTIMGREPNQDRGAVSAEHKAQLLGLLRSIAHDQRDPRHHIANPDEPK